jgi:2-oxoglutarate dehydrogenase E1 component
VLARCELVENDAQREDVARRRDLAPGRLFRRHVAHRSDDHSRLGEPCVVTRFAVSPLAEFTDGKFRDVIPDETADPAEVTRVVLCSGKMYYELAAARAQQGSRNVAIIRVEQLYPFGADSLLALLSTYREGLEVVWAQEEPKNMGAWSYVAPQLRVATGNMLTIRYIGRPERASPAEGYSKAHEVEQQRIVAEVLNPAPASAKRKTSKV